MPTTFIDTHAWLWWVTGDRRLSRRASDVIADAVRSSGVFLSMISIWEVAKKVEKQELVLDRPIREWIDQAVGVAGLSLVELTPVILVESCGLPQPFHGDPADQTIVASARHHHGRLVTKDGNRAVTRTLTRSGEAVLSVVSPPCQIKSPRQPHLVPSLSSL